jgi:hypothetical protein
MPAEKTARHAARASASIEVLDQLEALLADGRSWIQGDYWNDVGGFCLVGGIEFIRAGRREGDAAITYLSRAILGTTASRRRVIRFNDSRHAEIRAVIAAARERAREVADGWA